MTLCLPGWRGWPSFPSLSWSGLCAAFDWHLARPLAQWRWRASVWLVRCARRLSHGALIAETPTVELPAPRTLVRIERVAVSRPLPVAPPPMSIDVPRLGAVQEWAETLGYYPASESGVDGDLIRAMLTAARIIEVMPTAWRLEAARQLVDALLWLAAEADAVLAEKLPKQVQPNTEPALRAWRLYEGAESASAPSESAPDAAQEATGGESEVA